MPSRPTTTHDALQKLQTSRSLPSFVQPHREAATASITVGLLEYVDNLKVSRRVRKDCRDEGLYSAEGESGVGELALYLNVKAVLAFAAARLRIAVKCGAFLVRSGAALLRAMRGADWD